MMRPTGEHEVIQMAHEGVYSEGTPHIYTWADWQRAGETGNSRSQGGMSKHGKGGAVA